jgi:single-stranded-DNA-specific exonuclease
VATSTPTPARNRPEFTLEPFDYGAARALMAGLGLAEPVAVTLVRRGYDTVAEARAFLEADEQHDPFAFDTMAEVVARIRAAIDAGRRITVHGDYDVDGVCSTALLIRALREEGAQTDWLIPDRMADGYGLTSTGVETIAARGTSLLITVDCGIGSAAEVEAAKLAGLEVIVTDHHHPGAELPDCPILHPVLSGYPCEELCATGVAFKLAAALRGAEAVRSDLDLVALATVADLVPLRGENRSLVRLGLAEARRARRPGLRALMAVASVRPERLDEGDIAFRLGPRINAAGRLYRADAGVELMLCADQERAARIATELDRANRERRTVEEEVLRGAERARSELPDELRDAPGLVLAGQGWHPGVVGIVASRLAERLWRPVILVALDTGGMGRGSGRSVPGFDLLAALDSCAEHLVRHGGHRAAAGLELEADRLEGFRRSFAECVAARIEDGESGQARREPVDAVVGGESLGLEVAEQLARLGPFGQGNPEVRLLIAGAELGDVRPMGEGERHARFSIRSGPRRALGVAFGVDGRLAAAGSGPLDVSVRLELNEWNGSVEPRVVLGEVYPPAPEGEAAADPEVGTGAQLELSDGEYWRRVETESELDLEVWPPAAVASFERSRERRELVDRSRCSGVAAIAGLASGGESVLAICADALRRRELVERAVRPARFGGGEVAIASGRGPRSEARAAAARVLGSGSGIALCDWAAIEADPGLPSGFAHLVIVDPAPFEHLVELAAAGSGYLHQLGGGDASELSLRVLADEWPSRDSLAFCLRGLRRALAGREWLEPELAREALCGPGRTHPRSPEACARLTRVLGELGLLRWVGNRPGGSLTVLHSGGTDLDSSQAYIAYRKRYEEGRRYLSERRQSS